MMGEEVPPPSPPPPKQNPYLAHWDDPQLSTYLPSGRHPPHAHGQHPRTLGAGSVRSQIALVPRQVKRRLPGAASSIIPSVRPVVTPPPAVPRPVAVVTDHAPPPVQTILQQPADTQEQHVSKQQQQKAPSTTVAKPRVRPTHSHGNYDRYYRKRTHRARVDTRLALFDKDWFRGKKVLDVGCNAGVMAIQIAMLCGAAEVEGVDIDPLLVRKARAGVVNRASLVQPERESTVEQDADADRGDAMDVDRDGVAEPVDSHALDVDYFPQSCTHLFGPLPIVDEPISTDAPSNPYGAPPPPPPRFPANIKFRCGDWLHEPNPSLATHKYDVILALSISKWIHLNHGDAGLRRFFKRCYHSLNDGGVLLLEPQPWDSYTKADSRLDEEMKANMRNIQLRPEGFEEVLREEIKFGEVVCLGRSENATPSFRRPIFRCVK
ncbi:Bicoid-interacting protein 3-domain-containing protein [Fimicolochytrium jonesii]|uniref:Bicoid-interacting protein 3-domain-containing protein n=1 Tax=Fimicolochytrium jonesii TaxID=1396493 RepID=UPI0022FDF966|nr:Bicoid-interacting protein 3-domain-containing protein [Fimicolochytrium jonesii]KAI8816158.1 Bicoid-interacting protein 3-domain-containing protein [Fimicolochytrium jonesii]